MTCKEIKQVKAKYKELVIGMTPDQSKVFKQLFDSCCESHDFQCECGEFLMELDK